MEEIGESATVATLALIAPIFLLKQSMDAQKKSEEEAHKHRTPRQRSRLPGRHPRPLPRPPSLAQRALRWQGGRRGEEDCEYGNSLQMPVESTLLRVVEYYEKSQVCIGVALTCLCCWPVSISRRSQFREHQQGLQSQAVSLSGANIPGTVNTAR